MVALPSRGLWSPHCRTSPSDCGTLYSECTCVDCIGLLIYSECTCVDCIGLLIYIVSVHVWTV